MQRGGINMLNTEAFFSKVITGEKGITFDMKGDPLLYRKPKVNDQTKIPDYSLPTAEKRKINRTQTSTSSLERA